MNSENHAGNFVSPSTSSFRAAIAGVNWRRGQEFYVSLTDAPRADAYPIMAASLDYLPLPPRVVQEDVTYWEGNWGTMAKESTRIHKASD
jgi:hypothetical protein